jgi:hypothetical protein
VIIQPKIDLTPIKQKLSTEENMRFGIGVAAFLLTLFCFVVPAQAANSDSLSHLLESRSCLGCDLRNADLQDADLRAVNLKGADLSGANLSGANLMAANLQQANLSKADLSNSTVFGVNLFNANLREANIKGVRFGSARFCHTTLPDGKQFNQDC